MGDVGDQRRSPGRVHHVLGVLRPGDRPHADAAVIAARTALTGTCVYRAVVSGFA